MKKTIVTMSVAGALLIGGALPVSADNVQAKPIMVMPMGEQDRLLYSTKHDTNGSEHLTVSMKFPQFQQLGDKQFQEQLNQKIASFYQSHKREMEQQANEASEQAEQKKFPFHKHELKMDYKVKEQGDLVSVVVTTSSYTGGANSNTEVDSFNFMHKRNMHELTLSDIVKMDEATKAAKQAVSEQVNYAQGLTSLQKDQAFYIEGGQLKLVFDKYEVAAGVAGTPEVRLNLDELKKDNVDMKLGGLNVDTKSTEQENEHYNMSLKMPVITNLDDKEYEKQVNQQIKEHYESYEQSIAAEAKQFASEAKKYGFPFRPYDLSIDYKLKTKGNIVSIVLYTRTYTGGANGMSFVDSINFVNAKEAKEMSLFDLGEKEVVNKQTKEAIEQQYGSMYRLDSLSEDQAFYVDGDDVTLIFDKYEIAAGAAGTPTITLSYDDIKKASKHEK